MMHNEKQTQARSGGFGHKSMVWVKSKVGRMQGEQFTEEYKARCVCLLRCACNKMVWRVYEIKRVCAVQVKCNTPKKQILKNLTH